MNDSPKDDAGEQNQKGNERGALLRNRPTLHLKEDHNKDAQAQANSPGRSSSESPRETPSSLGITRSRFISAARAATPAGGKPIDTATAAPKPQKPREQAWNQYGVSDPLVGPGTAKGNPGSMAMAAKVHLHSRLAINLFRGRKGDPAKKVHGIIGLARFGRQVGQVWVASAQDDPYADQCLLNIEAAYEAARQTLESKLKALNELLGGMEDFEVQMQTSVQPVEVELQFFCPWGFRASVLLRDFDKLVRMALTANHLGLFVEGDWQNTVHDAARSLRHMFAVVDDWIPTGVKRADIRAKTKVAKRARARYAERRRSLTLDPAVLAGDVRAQLVPASPLLEQYRQELARKEAVKETAEPAKSRKEAAQASVQEEQEAVKEPFAEGEDAAGED